MGRWSSCHLFGHTASSRRRRTFSVHTFSEHLLCSHLLCSHLLEPAGVDAAHHRDNEHRRAPVTTFDGAADAATAPRGAPARGREIWILAAHEVSSHMVELSSSWCQRPVTDSRYVTSTMPRCVTASSEGQAASSERGRGSSHVTGRARPPRARQAAARPAAACSRGCAHVRRA